MVFRTVSWTKCDQHVSKLLWQLWEETHACKYLARSQKASVKGPLSFKHRLSVEDRLIFAFRASMMVVTTARWGWRDTEFMKHWGSQKMTWSEEVNCAWLGLQYRFIIWRLKSTVNTKLQTDYVVFLVVFPYIFYCHLLVWHAYSSIFRDFSF